MVVYDNILFSGYKFFLDVSATTVVTVLNIRVEKTSLLLFYDVGL